MMDLAMAYYHEHSTMIRGSIKYNLNYRLTNLTTKLTT